MPPIIATAVCGFGILILLMLNRDGKRVSAAVWLPVAWLSICGSRTVSQWIGGIGVGDSANNLVEGSPLDALLFTGLMTAGVLVLFSRKRSVGKVLLQNGPLLMFLLYCAVSCLWSDYPFVAFKRWIKAVGDLVMVLIILTDREPIAALKRLLAYSGFVLIPLSILLIRYFPNLGRGYSAWTGQPYNAGVATGKNGLGYVCLIFGLGSLWCFLEVLRTRERYRAVRRLIAQGAVLVLALWLFRMANSATSFSCFLIGSGLMTVMGLRALSRRPAVVHVVVGGLLFMVFYGVLLNPAAGLVETVGRDATLTGRTVLWKQVLNLTANPLFGAGYESFWLGERLETMWRINWEHPNQAHNGYLEIFLDLGWVGLTLLSVVMVSGYRSVVRSLRQRSELGRIRLAFFVVAAIYNLTEHAFRELHPVWIIFLLAVIIVRDPVVFAGRVRRFDENSAFATPQALTS
jgi:O-antigen ligase